MSSDVLAVIQYHPVEDGQGYSTAEHRLKDDKEELFKIAPVLLTCGLLVVGLGASAAVLKFLNERCGVGFHCNQPYSSMIL